MPRLAKSPSPVRRHHAPWTARQAGCGASDGVVRWKADLDLGRHLLDREKWWGWYHCAPAEPLVRADGAVISDWNGIVRCHGPTGQPLWQRDLALEPEKSWHEFWGGLVCVDGEDFTWVETRSGLTRLSPGGSVEIVGPDLKASGFGAGIGTLLPAGGFVRSYGTDEHWYTGHWPCQEGVVEILDDAGQVVRSHPMGLCPNGVEVLTGGSVLAFFVDANSFARAEALEIDAQGEIAARHASPEGADVAQWRARLIEEHDPERGHARFETVVTMGSGIRLRDPQGSDLLDRVSADPPTIDERGRCYVTRVAEEALTLACLEGDRVLWEARLLDRASLRLFAYSHGGRPGKQWAETRYFESPTALGPDGSTLVTTHLDEGRCWLFCVG